MKTRPYNSQRRREQAEATRQNILDAAFRLFATNGYIATTLPMIAREAGVSLPTVTAIFGTKYALLDTLITTTVRGDNESGPLAARSWWQAMLHEPDPLQQLTLCATNIRNIHERTTDIFEMVRSAATADPELADRQRQLAKGRLGDMRSMAKSLAEKGKFRLGMTVERATDLLWVFASAEMYRMLVVERGWSPSVYEQWLAQTLIETLLDYPTIAG